MFNGAQRCLKDGLDVYIKFEIMTKEEYQKLLKSDYWRGYSFSLIKERNFTCEDCRRRFYNERNKLQVHHLVYRDVNPWSYSPEEVVVLCEECHKKRHGIFTEPKPTSFQSPNILREYSETHSYSPNDIQERTFIADTHNYWSQEKDNGFKPKYIIYGLLLFLFVLWIGISKLSKYDAVNEKESLQEYFQQTQESPVTTTPQVHRGESVTQENLIRDKSNSKQHSPNDAIKAASLPLTNENSLIHSENKIPVSDAHEVDNNKEVVNENQNVEVANELSTLELLEKKHHADVVKRAQKAGVSTEGSTTEILERIHHADVVKRAQKAGVSTEGSTTEILERIHHADVVKRAQKAGVSTEGSTIEILERMNHADVVKRAQKAGVSTEGTTIEILERIHRKNLEKYNK